LQYPSVAAVTEPSALAPAEALTLFLNEQRSAATRRAYAADLRDFFGGEPQPQQVALFVALPAPELCRRLFAYKAELTGRGVAEATLNRRLSVLRSLLRYAHRLGLAACDGSGLVSGEKLPPSQKKPELCPDLLKRLMSAPGTGCLRGMRDTAILHLLCQNAVTRTELCALEVADFSPDQRRLTIRSGRAGKPEPLPLSRPTCRALSAYLAAAGHADVPAAPLFRNLDHRPGIAGERLTVDGLSFLVRKYGHALGIEGLTPRELGRSASAAARRWAAERENWAIHAAVGRRELTVSETGNALAASK
jgi:integrase/recombinase XerC